jgi:putative protein kinase ArgK-like GTPase of G3E family
MSKQEWTPEIVQSFYDSGEALEGNGFKNVADAINAALAAEHDAGAFGRHLTELRAKYERQLAAEAVRSIESTTRVQQQVNDMARQLTDEREKLKPLVDACMAYVALFEDSDMRPEEECHGLYARMSDALAKVKEGE